MAFVQSSGKVTVEWYRKAASTVFTNGALCGTNGTGEIIPATSTSTTHVGVIQKDIAATDSDYASTTLVPVLVPTDETEWEIDVTTGTATEATEGTYVDLTNSLGVDVSASAHDAVFVTKFVSGSKIIGKINSFVGYKNAV